MKAVCKRRTFPHRSRREHHFISRTKNRLFTTILRNTGPGYFAEFAQNANDACKGENAGEVRIWTRPGWLFVANNGRRINGTDLLGLCRFFANGSKIESTTDDFIGKFGIGFKSCYRIGTEVWVHTWEHKVEQFAFRIPLCHNARPQSHYNEQTFKRILGYLDRKDPRSSQDELGFCTPEFCDAWPMEIENEASAAQAAAPKQGTVFAIRLHEEGAAVLKDRLQDQRNQVFELCPLFVPCLRVTKLEDTALTLIEHDQLRLAVESDAVAAENRPP